MSTTNIFNLALSWTIRVPTRPSKVENGLIGRIFPVVIRRIAIGFLAEIRYPLRVLQQKVPIHDPNLVNIRRHSPQTICKLPTPHGCCCVGAAFFLYSFAVNISSPMNFGGTPLHIIEDTSRKIPYCFITIC